MPKFKLCKDGEDQSHFIFTHRCINGELFTIPRYIFIPPGYNKDFTIDGYKRIKDDTIKLIFCPVCRVEDKTIYGGDNENNQNINVPEIQLSFEKITDGKLRQLWDTMTTDNDIDIKRS